MMICHKTVSKLYDKVIQSFNFPFPEHVAFDSEKLDIFSFTRKNSDYLTKTCELSHLGKVCYASLRSVDFLCQQNLVIQK